MKKILIYAPNAPTSGVTNIVYNLHQNMEDDIHISMISWPENEKLKQIPSKYNGNFYPFKVYYLRHPFQYKKCFSEILNADSFDVIVFNLSYLLTLFPIKSAQKKHIKNIIVYSHSSNIESSSAFKRWILYIIHVFNKFRLKFFPIKRLACSQHAAEWLFGKNSNTTIIKNAIDIKKYSYNSLIREQKREQFHVADKFVIGNVGRLSYPKNQQFLIKIFKYYLTTNSNAVLWIVGDGPLKSQLTSLINDYHLQEQIYLWGNQNNISDLLQCMDIFIMPSIFEGAPVALIEAQANGLPCIISDTISKECVINNNITVKSLSCPLDEWKDTISAVSLTSRDEKAACNLSNKGWDLHHASQQLQKIYTA